MRQIKFTITEDEVREIAESINIKNLLNKEIKLILEMVECDEFLARDIHTSIKDSITEVLSLRKIL